MEIYDFGKYSPPDCYVEKCLFHHFISNNLKYFFKNCQGNKLPRTLPFAQIVLLKNAKMHVPPLPTFQQFKDNFVENVSEH